MSESVVEDLLRYELFEETRSILREALLGGTSCYLVLNAFNVRIDVDEGTVVVEDELDPDREEQVALEVFARLVEACPAP